MQGGIALRAYGTMGIRWAGFQALKDQATLAEVLRDLFSSCLCVFVAKNWN